ncbi:unnamed protein product [Anisakis simplex]|uniref:AT10584p (inferred by orthology to a D. melanogaster protein) n=1 Tax=Anisakis simplex TaxID=6269 RepID=A0A0M3IY32_ANISI|nr:unnamed protein product [Anisakis simplex]
MIVDKISKFGKTIYDHKKKAIAAGVALIFLGRYLERNRRDACIRAAYCREASKYGLQTVSPDDRPRRVSVLINVSANDRYVYDTFKTNALPLLNLAGLEVTLIRAEDEDQTEAVAGALDSAEADALYIVGGDGTVSRVLTGIYRNRKDAVLPVGIFPGGNENRFLSGIVPQVFCERDDVRRYCESAMALIEGNKREVYIARCSLVTVLDGFNDSDYHQKDIYGLSDVNAGWFLHAEMRKRKLWYWGALRRRFAYFWEMVKRYPEPMKLQINYEEYCEGCNKCRGASLNQTPKTEKRWWHYLIGTPKYKDESENKSKKDYSSVTNENCGKTHELQVNAKDLYIDHEQQQDSSMIRVRYGGSQSGRMDIMRDGWKRCKADAMAVTPDASFYENDLKCRSVQFAFLSVPKIIERFALFGDEVKLGDGAKENETSEEILNKKVKLETTDKKIVVYLPKTLRWSLDEIRNSQAEVL